MTALGQIAKNSTCTIRVRITPNDRTLFCRCEKFRRRAQLLTEPCSMDALADVHLQQIIQVATPGFIAPPTEKWVRVIKFAGTRAE
jgi:hypothetical protein